MSDLFAYPEQAHNDRVFDGSTVRVSGGSGTAEPPHRRTPSVASRADALEDLLVGGGLAGRASARPVLAKALSGGTIPEATAVRRQLISHHQPAVVPPELQLEIHQQDLALGEEWQQDAVSSKCHLADGFQLLAGGKS